MQYEIMQTMHADNPQGKCVPFKAGQIISDGDMLAGCLEAGLARQTIRNHVEPPKPEPTTPPAAPPMQPTVHAPHSAAGPHGKHKK